MSIIIKTETEIEKMRIAGKLAAEVLEIIEPYVVPALPPTSLIKFATTILLRCNKPYPRRLIIAAFQNQFAPQLINKSATAFPAIKNLNPATLLI